MMGKKMIVVQCWDDGVTADIRLLDILRRHGAKATFNLNVGLHERDSRGHGWTHRGTAVARLTLAEMPSVYEGMTIANHTLTHPHLENLPIDEARREIVEGRDRLQQLFQQPVEGFAYPFGTYNDEVKDAVREAGHVYARTVENVDCAFPPVDAMEMPSNCHFRADDFMQKYEAAKSCGVFYFWGHSYEMISDDMWDDFERTIERISTDPDSEWADVVDLFKPAE